MNDKRIKSGIKQQNTFELQLIMSFSFAYLNFSLSQWKGLSFRNFSIIILQIQIFTLFQTDFYINRKKCVSHIYWSIIFFSNLMVKKKHNKIKLEKTKFFMTVFHKKIQFKTIIRYLSRKNKGLYFVDRIEKRYFFETKWSEMFRRIATFHNRRHSTAYWRCTACYAAAQCAKLLLLLSYASTAYPFTKPSSSEGWCEYTRKKEPCMKSTQFKNEKVFLLHRTSNQQPINSSNV